MKTAETPVVDVIGTLRQHSLLDAANLERVAKETYADSKVLLRALVQKGLLTPFQANRVMSGRAQELLLGSYIVLDMLGAGGMGAVYKAKHQTMGRVVALKVIRPERLSSANAIRRFRREIEAAAMVNHPNIVQAFDADETGGRLTLVMEYVDGTDLSKMLKEKGPLPIDSVLNYVLQAATGLEHAHEKGLVHRDIKPQNLLLTRDGVVKVLDLGLARQLEEDQSLLTREGVVVGTPDYVAPEQVLNSHNVDIRADIYSLGATLYVLLTGKVPFPGSSVAQKLLKQQKEEPPPVESHRPQIAPAIAAIVRRMMAKKPQDRFQTPAEVIRALKDPSAFAVDPFAADPSADLPEPVRPSGPSFKTRVAERFAQLGKDVQEKDWITLLLAYRWWVLSALGFGLVGLLLLILLLLKIK